MSPPQERQPPISHNGLRRLTCKAIGIGAGAGTLVIAGLEIAHAFGEPQPLTPDDFRIGPNLRDTLKRHWVLDETTPGLVAFNDYNHTQKKIVLPTNLVYWRVSPNYPYNMYDATVAERHPEITHELIAAHRADNPDNKVALRIGDGAYKAEFHQLAIENQYNERPGQTVVVSLDPQSPYVLDQQVNMNDPNPIYQRGWLPKALESGIIVSARLNTKQIESPHTKYDAIYTVAPYPNIPEYKHSLMEIFHYGLRNMLNTGKFVIVFALPSKGVGELDKQTLVEMETYLRTNKRRYEIIHKTTEELHTPRLQRKVGALDSDPAYQWIPNKYLNPERYKTVPITTLIVYGQENQDQTEDEYEQSQLLQKTARNVVITGLGGAFTLWARRRLVAQHHRELVGRISKSR